MYVISQEIASYRKITVGSIFATQKNIFSKQRRWSRKLTIAMGLLHPAKQDIFIQSQWLGQDMQMISARLFFE